MKKRMALCAAAIAAAIACVGSLHAHHSASMFDLSTPVWVKGTVVRFEPINPHSRIALEETQEDGQVYRWIVEGPSLVQLERRRIEPDFLKPGDDIEFCAFALKQGTSLRRPPPDAQGYVHGHVLVAPDGRKRLWGSYGRLSECVRSTYDQRQSWLDFVNADPRARNAWCAQRSRIPSRAFVDEIDSLMADPCE